MRASRAGIIPKRCPRSSPVSRPSATAPDQPDNRFHRPAPRRQPQRRSNLPRLLHITLLVQSTLIVCVGAVKVPGPAREPPSSPAPAISEFRLSLLTIPLNQIGPIYINLYGESPCFY